jgi:hypothetical protein
MTTTVTNKPKSKVRLLCTITGMNGGLVIAERERALRIARVTTAIETARTWGEFRKLMPRAEYSEVIQGFKENHGRRPKSTDRFESETVPGYCDGYYPPWLQQEMLSLFSDKLREELEKCGGVEATFTSGPYLHLDPKALPEVKEILERNGYFLEDGTHLSFT